MHARALFQPVLRRGVLGLSVLALLATTPGAVACDICAVYTATEQRETRTGFRLGIAEQYSYFGTTRRDGDRVRLPVSEYMQSSITQFVLGYGLTPRIGVQLGIPLVSRTFRRLEDGAVERDHELGLGDLSLVGTWNAFSHITETSVFRCSLLAGIKFPTGDTARLREEFVPRPAAPARRPRHSGGEPPPPGEPPESGGLHGHDLTLGSGSYDGILGAQMFWSWRRGFATAAIQYAIRGDGDFAYRFANDLTFSGGPGAFLLLEHDYSVGLQALLAGETKGNDTQQGVRTDDTAVTALYLGPGLTATWGTSLAADLNVVLPVLQHNSGLQLLQDVRIRGGLTWRF